ncbi:Rpn family recombination-promoting nuclease/putative transposase [Nannocystaceae bacterium ST9]
MTHKPHDAVFKHAFEQPEHAADLFRSVLPPAIADAIAWSTIAREPGSFVDVELADRHSDLLFSAELLGGRAFLYLLLEHQSSLDVDMPLRMLVYQVRIWERHRKQSTGPLPPILPVLVSHAPGGWTGARHFHELIAPDPSQLPELAQFVPSFRLLVEDLAHLSNDDLKARTLAVFPKLVLWLLRDARREDELLRNLATWAHALREAARTPNGMESMLVLMRYISLVNEQVPWHEFHAKIREVAPEAESAAMTIAEQLIAEGRAKGRNEGRSEGRSEGRNVAEQMLGKLLVLKFGELPADIEARVSSASLDELQAWADRVLRATTLADVFTA